MTAKLEFCKPAGTLDATVTCLDCATVWDYRAVLPDFDRVAVDILADLHVCGEYFHGFGFAQRTPVSRILEQQEGCP